MQDASLRVPPVCTRLCGASWQLSCNMQFVIAFSDSSELLRPGPTQVSQSGCVCQLEFRLFVACKQGAVCCVGMCVAAGGGLGPDLPARDAHLGSACSRGGREARVAATAAAPATTFILAPCRFSVSRSGDANAAGLRVCRGGCRVCFCACIFCVLHFVHGRRAGRLRFLSSCIFPASNWSRHLKQNITCLRHASNHDVKKLLLPLTWLSP